MVGQFRGENREIDKELENFEINEKVGLGPNLITRTTSGPSLDFNVSGVKQPTKWTRIARPSMP